MAIDMKYGRVTLQYGSVPDDEPVVVFRARDALLPELLAFYALFCTRAGSPRGHLDLINDRREQIEAWQRNHETQIPRSAGYLERMGLVEP